MDRHQLASALRAAGDRARALQFHVRAQRKGDGSPVTEGDREAERILVEHLSAQWPSAGIRGEEGAAVEGDPTWWVDPIDGTGVYTEGLAYWGTTAGLIDRGRPVLGGLYHPLLNDMWLGDDQGAWHNGERLRPNWSEKIESWSTMMVPSGIHLAPPIRWPGKCRVLGSTAANIVLAAAGRADVAIVPWWKPWDVAGALAFAFSAGAAVTDWKGTPVDRIPDDSIPILVGSPSAISYLATRRVLEHVLPHVR